jgi:hypothetical protein
VREWNEIAVCSPKESVELPRHRAKSEKLEKRATEWRREIQDRELATHVLQRAREKLVKNEEARLPGLDECVYGAIRIRTESGQALCEKAKSASDEIESLRIELQ